MSRIPILALLTVLWLPLSAPGQTVDTQTEEEAAAVTEQDIGNLQAELARVEAERQRLADVLASTSTDTSQLEQLSAQNLALREQLSTMEEVVYSQRKNEQRNWFIVGGTTVALSLLAGWLLAQLGGRRKRDMWLN